MPLLVIRLHPEEPIEGDAFTSYLEELTITAFDVSFNNLDGSPIGDPAQYLELPDNPLGQIPPPLDPDTTIVQHYRQFIPLFPFQIQAVATAVIEIPDPPAGEEYRTADVRLEISRGGGGDSIAHQQTYYNVPVVSGSLPADPNDFIDLEPTSLLLALPSANQTSPVEILPENGAAPNYSVLRSAVEEVLNAESVDLSELGNLNLDQCRHIAYEIIWNREAYPLPEPNRTLEQIYTISSLTEDDENSEDDERERQIFEGDLLTYYTKHNTEADRLTNFVFALSAAIWCEEQSKKAKKVGFYFPIFVDSPEREAKVILTGVGDAAIVPTFEVDAAYFYALTAILPPQVKREERYRMATINEAEQIVTEIKEAIDDNIIAEPSDMSVFQAARCLRSLGATGEKSTPECQVTPGTLVHSLVTDWLNFDTEEEEEDIKENIARFWTTLSPDNVRGHLDLVLCGITKAHDPLIAAIKSESPVEIVGDADNSDPEPVHNITSVADLVGQNNKNWQDLLEPETIIIPPNPNPEPNNLLPEFTKPGTREERTQAFIRHLRKFFNVANVFERTETNTATDIPSLERSPNPLDALLVLYPDFSFTTWDSAELAAALETIFPDDPQMRSQFTAWLLCIRSMIELTEGIEPFEMQFSVIEALWARGFTNREVIAKFENRDRFREALIGTVAYEEAETIWNNAQVSESIPEDRPTGFKPINPDGSLVNCIPPMHLSPLGPVAYLNELLRVSPESNCEEPLPVDVELTLANLLAERRGALGSLLATKANLEIPIPLIDIVNESLEYLVVHHEEDSFAGTVYNTARDEVGGHLLTSNINPEPNVFLHDPETLLEALPEHSTPATPTVEQSAYDKLRNDFSACNLPYSQPLDIARTYLEQLGTSRYATMRRFRQEITEFVLAPNNEPEEFQAHLWRYPVRIETAIEYLKITPEEYSILFQNNILTDPRASGRDRRGEIPLYQLYGFAEEFQSNQTPWTKVVVRLSEFLDRTCLSYCEFIELWQSKFVLFGLKNSKSGFPECEPCCLERYVIEFDDSSDSTIALKQLAIFIRLWHKLQLIPNAEYTFTELRDICDVLELFINDGEVNPDFIRQLVAFQILRDDFQLPLTDGTVIDPDAITAERTHLLAFWVEGATKFDWAIDSLLDRIQQYAIAVYHCRCREPEFIKLLKTNLDSISALAGFDPNNVDFTWHAKPTHTLRLAEILAKIYASQFHVGELLFLFTAREHLQGDDPFPLQTNNEAKDSPLGFPDDEEQYSLWQLRHKLLAVEVTPETAQQWTWRRMDAVLKDEFGFAPTSGNNHWLSLGRHFFPHILAENGMTVDIAERQYRTSLSSTSEAMWNTPFDGPFRYDVEAEELWTQIPLTDAAVLEKLGRIRQLSATERNAVRELYFLPRLDLVHLGYIFENFAVAEVKLIEEPDEDKRWIWFQQEFARFYQRCQIIAEHLANHVADITDNSNLEGTAIAKLLLKTLWADENFAVTAWENDNGQTPEVTWQPQPNGGAFAALLGLTGTGMLAQYFVADDELRWQEVRGGAEVFGAVENRWNVAIPTVLPSMNTTLTSEQLRFAVIRNGFAIANPDGEMLGGAEPFMLKWQGLFLIEQGGEYGFSAGAPTSVGELPDFEAVACFHRWRVTLKRGQKTWILLAHNWQNEEAPAACSSAIELKRGFYELTIELERSPLFFDGWSDVFPQTTGFQLKYQGADTVAQWLTVPHDKLFLNLKNGTLQLPSYSQAIEAVSVFLATRYVSTVRDMRRTYQRAFKAMLLAHRLQLSARKISDGGQSELGYLLSHPVNFVGQAYYQTGASFTTHKANFDLNFLPVLDNYFAPPETQDMRVSPTAQRQQAMFDWWERLYDYTVMRREAERSPEQPAWLLFHESAEFHPDEPADLLRHLGIDLRHTNIVLQYYSDLLVTSVELEDDRWTVRVWQAEKWIRALLARFYPQDIRQARPDLWASDDPSISETAFETVVSGNYNLTKFYRDGCIENGQPIRYLEIKQLNDGLRQRGRNALVAYLTRMHRIPLSFPWEGFATEAKHLSELLLLDVETGICQKASRIEEAVTAVHLFIQRARLGLESRFISTSEFVLVWERHFASFRTWEACKRRLIYRENWIEWDELQTARQTEAFQFLESELRRAALTMPMPAGLAQWQGTSLPERPSLNLLQHREPATIDQIEPWAGLGLRGTPERHARPTWLAAIDRASSTEEPPDDGGEGGEGGENEPVDPPVVLLSLARQPLTDNELPMWLESAIRLGTKFVRVAAASIPPATTTLESKCDQSSSSVCCEVCGKVHPALIDEYYFWIESSHYYAAKEYDTAIEDAVEQVAEWGADASNPQTDWHLAEQLPGLLNWKPQLMAHLRWCRVHNGEFQQTRQSDAGVKIDSETEPELIFLGRRGDSLNFRISGGIPPVGVPAPPQPPNSEIEPPPSPGFRYDLALDRAIVLPEVITPPAPDAIAELSAFPLFAWFESGKPLLPPSMFSTAIAIAGHLRSHCRLEAALKWYELVYNPLERDNTWHICPPKDEDNYDYDNYDNYDDLDTEAECCCPSDLVDDSQTENRAILLHYLKTLMQWGQALMRRNTPEAFQQARLIFDTAAKILGDTPTEILTEAETKTPRPVARFKPECAPLNLRLMCLYSKLSDRLTLIHTCLNAKRLKNGRPNLDMPYFGNSELRDCWKINRQVCIAENDWCLPRSPYRFMVLIQKAQELAGEVRAFGSALLAAYEKGDAEYLSNMRTLHENQLLNLTLEIRQNQWRESDWQVQALRKTKEITQTRLRYYQNLIDNALIPGESQYEPLTISSSAVRTGGNISVAIGQALNLIPDPHVGFPANFVKLPPGEKLSMIFSGAGTIANTVADILNVAASLGLTKAGWERRLEEWEHQVEVLTVETEQIERQILAAERRRAVAQRELNNHQQQIENVAEVHDFLRDKFTNHALYLWMQQETAAMYYQMYELALHCAYQAQAAFNFERGFTARKFIPEEIWDNLHEGLLSGDRLQLALRGMEKAYYDENVREYELTKHISLRLHFPLALLQLKTTGYCEIELPEWLFDLDYPGHYMRRIKNVTITIPCVVGPYTGVHCRLTLLSSKTRVQPQLIHPPHVCCDREIRKNGYEPVPNDTRFVSIYSATEAIATSSSQNDSGMFELNFRDERYLPFEFSGAVSRWRIELPFENNHFDIDTLSDLILHLNFTAREGGGNLRQSANELAQQKLPGSGWRVFDIKREFPEAWYSLTGNNSQASPKNPLNIRLSRNIFPYLTGNKRISIQQLEILFESSEADPSKHHIIEFWTGDRQNKISNIECDDKVHSIACIADAKWPGLFHGVLEVNLEIPIKTGHTNLGTFEFPNNIGLISNVYLLCAYRRSDNNETEQNRLICLKS